ncbi:MAG: glycosyltransferase family 4 protein [Candidatus Rehaiarchaeum fermentans]|nr:glycosyltransferase family 4 protein [Candidatus Rehaiarchaeum fermentans]
MKKYDIVFILPGVSWRFPPGGFDIIYRLANNLNSNLIKTAIVFLKNPPRYIPHYKLDPNLTKKYTLEKKIFDKIFSVINVSYFFKLISKLNLTDYDYSILNNTDLYYFEYTDDFHFDAKIIFATLWETAYYVNELRKKRMFNAYYLIQNSEDDPSFSGDNSVNAAQTYNFNFKKVVINKKLLDRFISDDPLFFHVGIDTDFYKVLDNTQKEFDVLFSLRNNPSKGYKYAFDAIKELLNSVKDIRIAAFGDFKPNKLPFEISKISYYYIPTRKKLRELYNSSKIFVLPSLVEGMSLPPLEAMSCGAAVVATDNGGVNEYLIDGFNGIMIPVGCSVCIVDAVIDLLHDNAKRERLVLNGLSTATNFSYSKMCYNFAQLMKHELNLETDFIGNGEESKTLDLK